LHYQLFVSMVLNCVDDFVAKFKNKTFHQAFFQKADRIMGYGIAYAGSGFNKLEMKFGFPLKFVNKCNLDNYSQPTSAALMLLS